MAKPLVFRFGERDYAFALNKIDRARLYGSKEIEVLDEKNRRCELATLADDGRTIVGRGGTAIGYVSADGEWCRKDSLTPVDIEGNTIFPVPSSFAAPIELNDVVTVDEYLTHNIRLVYALEANEDIEPLSAQLNAGAIFKFPYSYRGGLEADAGFLLRGDDGHLFLAVGNPTSVAFVSLAQLAVPEDDDDLEDETDLMDFGML